jgi:hypothetical protein
VNDAVLAVQGVSVRGAPLDVVLHRLGSSQLPITVTFHRHHAPGPGPAPAYK